MIFVDASALSARFLEEDPFHEAALEGFRRLEASPDAPATSSLCVVEAVNVIARLTDVRYGARSGAQILDWPLEVIRPTLPDEKRALRLMESYAEKRASFVDCVSFVIMDARKIDTAFTFDEDHFVKLRKLKPWVPIPRSRKRR